MKNVTAVCWFLISSLLCATALAAPTDWAEGTSAHNDGATRDFYNRGAALPWRNFLGDWHDATGAAQGETPYTATTVLDTDEARFIEWDVTDLVFDWLDGAYPNQGMLLRLTGGGGPVDFRSREWAESAERPQLVLDTTGGTIVLGPEADTTLAGSTFTSQGQTEGLRVAAGNVPLLRFDVSGVAAGTLESATLRLFSHVQFGGSTEVGVFRTTPGSLGPDVSVQSGLAADFAADEGISDHADVLFFEDFSSDDWEDGFTHTGGVYVVTDSDPTRGFSRLQGRALRATMPEDANLGLNLHYDFLDETGAEPEAIYFRYYLRFANNWQQTVDGGKLPGISGTYNTAGWGGRRADGTNGWSARGLFELSVPDSDRNPLSQHTPVGSYVYHADMPTQYGDAYIWNQNWGTDGRGGVLDIDRWYCLELYVEMNTPSSNDGVLRAWVDGYLSFEKTDFRFRDVDSLKIERVWFNLYHGGTALSPADQDIYIDNIVIARSYIGPMGDSSSAEGDVGDAADAGSGDAVDARSDDAADAGFSDADAGSGDASDTGSGDTSETDTDEFPDVSDLGGDADLTDEGGSDLADGEELDESDPTDENNGDSGDQPQDEDATDGGVTDLDQDPETGASDNGNDSGESEPLDLANGELGAEPSVERPDEIGDTSDSGCDCTTKGTSSGTGTSPGGLWWLGLLGLGLTRRRAS